MWTALYARVSTDEQAQQGFSIESQKERLAAFCRSQGFTECEFYIDDGYSGTSLQRPAMDQLLKDIRARLVKTVVVYRLDRLGRRQKDVLHLLEDVFEPFAVTFKSVTEPFDTATPFGRAMLGVLAVFAQLERDTIIERTTLGRRQRIRAGLWPGGRIPFGYGWSKEAQALYLEPEQAAIVQEIYKRFLHGETLTRISHWATQHSADRRWTHSAVRAILTRSVYAGFILDRGMTITGRHEAIVDEATWQAAQAELARRAAGTPATGAYLLSGLLVCGICGGRVVHFPYQSSRNGRVYHYEYYGCQAQHSRKKGQQGTCSLGFKRKDILEAQVTNALFQLSFSPVEVAQVYAELTAQGNGSEREALRQKLAVRLQAVEVKRKRWHLAYEEGVITPAQLAAKLAPLDVEAKALALQQEELAQPVMRPDPIASRYSEHVIRQAWPCLDIAEQRAVLRLAVKKITLFKGKNQLAIDWNCGPYHPHP